MDIVENGELMKDRIYVCHTYYHVYITLLTEFARPLEEQGNATLVLSTMSTNFETFKLRVRDAKIFEKIIEYDEKREDFFPELDKYNRDYGNIVRNMFSRMKFTKKFAQYQEKYIPVDFKEYQEIYVYCDSDPIGYYLNYKKIKYHSIEDGLNSLVNYDAARYDNRGNFKMKAFLASLNLIFIQNGYSKYCIDVQVNQIKGIRYPIKKHVEIPRTPLEERLTEKEKQIILKVFIKNKKKLEMQMAKIGKAENCVLVLTEPLCELDVREKIFRDIIDLYKDKATIVIKQHPRDSLDYEKVFSEYVTIDATVPMEVLNLIPNVMFEKVISVLTDIKAIKFGKEVIRLGPDFMDKYEEPAIHRQNEQFK